MTELGTVLWSENLKDVLAKTIGGEKGRGGKMFPGPRSVFHGP